MKNNMNSVAVEPLFHGIILVAGGAIGAGMFALPLVSAGAWFLWSFVAMIIVWWFTYLAAQLLADVNLTFVNDNSFDSIVCSILGGKWAAVNNTSIAFIMYILMYAYITAGSNILDAGVNQITALPRVALSIIFALIAAFIVCLNTSFVSRLSTLLMIGMGLSFITANSGLFAAIDVSSLFSDGPADTVFYMASALPVYVTAFACAGLVPSLVSHYRASPYKVGKSVLFGSLLTLLIYTIWLLLTLGNIDRDDFIIVAQNGGGVDALVGELQRGLSNRYMQSALNWFSHMAIITSFLSIAIGLVHFLQDRFQLGQSTKGRVKAVLMAFLPPTVCSALWAYGFVSAIGYAGLLVAFSFFIVPALLYSKQNAPCGTRQKSQWLSVLIFGVIIIVLKLAAIMSLLPTFPV
jgi:tryptophan-specific transport protein